MPELPEVETVVVGIQDCIALTSIIELQVYHHQLRHPIQQDLKEKLEDSQILAAKRRAKYIIIKTNKDYDLIIHLGMSGKLLIREEGYQAVKHDHIVMKLSNGKQLIFHDPRRFGMFFWTLDANIKLAHLGIEPLSLDFTAEYLFNKLQSRAIKVSIMDQKIVVGIGNIYACEALYRAGISPLKTKLPPAECRLLVKSIKEVLMEAILQGGTTLKDYRQVTGELGYFQQKLLVYGQKLCPKGHLITNSKISGRSSYYCMHCQS